MQPHDKIVAMARPPDNCKLPELINRKVSSWDLKLVLRKWNLHIVVTAKPPDRTNNCKTLLRDYTVVMARQPEYYKLLLDWKCGMLQYNDTLTKLHGLKSCRAKCTNQLQVLDGVADLNENSLLYMLCSIHNILANCVSRPCKAEQIMVISVLAI